MAVGGVLGGAGVPMPWVNEGIFASVIVMGLLIFAAIRPVPLVAVAIVALFALFHGHSHGSEFPPSASKVYYGFALIAATSLLHVIGVGVGQLFRVPGGRLILRMAGSAIAAAGIALLVG